MARWRRVTQIAGVTAGAAAAGLGAVIAAERLAAHRLRLSPDPAAASRSASCAGASSSCSPPTACRCTWRSTGPTTPRSRSSSATGTRCTRTAGTTSAATWRPGRQAGVLGPARPRAVRPGRRGAGHRGPDRQRPGGGDAGRGHRPLPGDPRRPLDGRHDDHGAGGPAPGAVRRDGGRRGPDRDHGGRAQRPGRAGARDAVAAADVPAAASPPRCWSSPRPAATPRWWSAAGRRRRSWSWWPPGTWRSAIRRRA